MNLCKAEEQTVPNVECCRETYHWFANLTNEELEHQARICIAAQLIIEQLIINKSIELNISQEMNNKLLEYFADRFDILSKHYCPEEQYFSNPNKKACPISTAAGILTYKKVNGEVCVLLAKRRGHDYWGNFGGKSDLADKFLIETAVREVREESSNVLNYNEFDLYNNPSHDLITYDIKNKPHIYRMYIKESQLESIDFAKFKDNEHTDYTWVNVGILYNALSSNKNILIEDKITIIVSDIQGNTIPLYPSLYLMLIQKIILDHLSNLIIKKPLRITHTQSVVNIKNQFRHHQPINSPLRKKQQITQTLLLRSQVMHEIKLNRKGKEKKPFNNKFINAQSELHLRAILDDDYIENSLEKNVNTFISRFIDQQKELKSEEKNNLANICINFISLEKSYSDKYIYFYHACNSQVAFLYQIYSRIYQLLTIKQDHNTFRFNQSFFDKFLNINDFIKKNINALGEINNYTEGFNEAVLSTNLFLFGNHHDDSCSSIAYFLKNSTAREFNLELALKDLFGYFSISSTEIEKLMNLYHEHYSCLGGALYQIAVPKQDASQISYPAGLIGKINPYLGNMDIFQILEQLENRLDNRSAFKEKTQYIQSVQARLMLSPLIKTKIKCSRGIDVYGSNENIFDSNLAHYENRLIQNLAYEILNNLNIFNENIISKKLPVLFIANELLTLNQIYIQEKITLSILIQAVKCKNYQLIQQSLINFPDLLYQRIESNYIESTPFDFNPNANHVLELIIKEGLDVEKILSYQCLNRYWYNHLPAEMQFNFSYLIVLVKVLPENEQYDFLIKYADIKDDSQLDEIKIVLGDSIFNKFILKVSSRNPSIRICWYLSTLKKLDSNEKLKFAIAYSFVIPFIFLFEKIFKDHFPDNFERLLIAESYLIIIKYLSGLKELLNLFVKIEEKFYLLDKIFFLFNSKWPINTDYQLSVNYYKENYLKNILIFSYKFRDFNNFINDAVENYPYNREKTFNQFKLAIKAEKIFTSAFSNKLSIFCSQNPRIISDCQISHSIFEEEVVSDIAYKF